MRALRDKWTLTSRLHDRADEGQPRRFVLDCNIGWQNYQDALGDFYEADAAYSLPDGGGYSAQFTKLPRLIRLGNDGRKRAYPVPGNDQVWVQLFKPAELPNLGTPVKQGRLWTWDRNAFTFALHVEPSRIKFSLVLKRRPAFNTLTIPFDSQGLIRQGALLLHNGVPVAELRRPWVRHAGMAEDEEPVPMQVDFIPGAVRLSIDPPWLDLAQYPVEIDPPLDLQVGASADDARENQTGAVSLTGGLVGFVVTAPNTPWHTGHRWLNLTIGQGDTIDVAYTRHTGGIADSDADLSVPLYGEANDNAPTFTTGANDITNRTRTTASATWNFPTTWDVDVLYNSPSLVLIVQEIIDRAGWVSGNALVILSRHTVAAGVNSKYCIYYDSDTTKAARLHIEFTASGGAARRIFVVS